MTIDKRQAPQLEEGYTSIANELLEAFIRYRLSGEEWQVLQVIMRKTYGFHKKEDKIALSQFYELTGMKKPSIIRALKKLIAKNIISKKANGEIGTYGINKVYATWTPLAKKLTSNNFISKKANDVSKSANAVSKKANVDLLNGYPQKKKETITKETIQKKVRITNIAQDKPTQTIGPSNEITTLIGLFRQINPSYKRFYSNRTQRDALQRMVTQNGFGQIEKTIKYLPETNKIKYCPIITTPLALENKLGDLLAFLQKEKSQSKIAVNPAIGGGEIV